MADAVLHLCDEHGPEHASEYEEAEFGGIGPLIDVPAAHLSRQAKTGAAFRHPPAPASAPLAFTVPQRSAGSSRNTFAGYLEENQAEQAACETQPGP